MSMAWHWQCTALSGKLKWQKNIQSISRLLRKHPHSGLRNEPPLDSLDPQSLNPFMASLWIRSGYDMKVGKSAETYQVGAHFKALIKAILVAPSRTLEKFFSFHVSLPRCECRWGAGLPGLSWGCNGPPGRGWRQWGSRQVTKRHSKWRKSFALPFLQNFHSFFVLIQFCHPRANRPKFQNLPKSDPKIANPCFFQFE